MTIQEILCHDETFRYGMLDRLRTDCAYYLGYGNRCKKHLWAGNEKEQIALMKALYNSFPENKRPEWLTMSDIERFEADMIKPEEKRTKKLVLNYQGRDSWSRPVYECGGRLYVDVDPHRRHAPNICTKNGNDFDGEPDAPVPEGTELEFVPCRDTW